MKFKIETTGKIQTPMQELIDLLEEEYKKFDAEDEVVYWFHNRGIRQAIKHAESMLEKEKETVCNAFSDAQHGAVESMMTAEEYFEETFNTKEK